MHEPSIRRVEEGTIKGVGLVDIFKAMAEDAEETDHDALDLVVTYIDPEDEFQIGDYVPELHLIVRRVVE